MPGSRPALAPAFRALLGEGESELGTRGDTQNPGRGSAAGRRMPGHSPTGDCGATPTSGRQWGDGATHGERELLKAVKPAGQDGHDALAEPQGVQSSKVSGWTPRIQRVTNKSVARVPVHGQVQPPSPGPSASPWPGDSGGLLAPGTSGDATSDNSSLSSPAGTAWASSEGPCPLRWMAGTAQPPLGRAGTARPRWGLRATVAAESNSHTNSPPRQSRDHSGQRQVPVRTGQ